MPQVAVRRAEPPELPVVMEILDDAARWLLERGIRRWLSPPPPECLSETREEIERGHVYLIVSALSEEVVGTFRIGWNGAPLWNDAVEAGYLYSLALRSSNIGQGIGKTVLDWLAGYFTSHGRRRFRLDCISSNARLRNWYERLGFVYRGNVTSGSYVLARYERDLNVSELKGLAS